MSFRKKGNNTRSAGEDSQDWEELSFDGGEFEDEAASFEVNTAAFGNIKAFAKTGRTSDAGDAADGYVPEEPVQAEEYVPEELPAREDDYDYEFDEAEYEYESEEPAYGEPAYEEPAYEESAYEEPAYEESAYEEPAYEESAYGEPAYEEPAYEESAYEEPIYEEPVENDFGDGLRIMNLNRQDEAEEEDDDDEPSFSERMGNKILIGASVAVLLIFAVAAFFILKGQSSEPVQTFASVSSDLENVDLIGGEALTALMAGKETEYLASLSDNTGTGSGTVSKYEETDIETETITVKLVMTSVEKDLKIKFTNSSTGKLIANIPFEVKVMDSSGNVYTWTDEDKDGIIYMSGLTAGTYRVALLKLDDELYENYVLSDSGTVKVQDTIVYAQVDVSAEIKEESEIDVSTEEAQVEIEVESVNTDTVEWVESTRTYVGEAYTLIDKLLISVPTASRVTGTFLATAITNSTASLTLTEGETGSISASSDADGAVLTYESGDESVATVSDDGTVTAVAAGSTSVTITETVTNAESSTTETTESCAVTVSAKSTESSSTGNSTTESSSTGSSTTESSTAESSSTGSSTTESSTAGSSTAGSTTYSAFTLSLSETELSLNKNTSETVTVTPQDNTSGESITYTCKSSDTSVAEAYMSDNTVTVKGIAAGTATITVSACYTNSTSVTASATFTVTVVSSTTALKTTDGRAVYVLEDGSYRIATYDDYYTDGMAYYVKTEGYTYTGWQTIDGKTYYYTAAGNYVVGNQVILGVQYTFSSTGVLQEGSGTLGIDVSSHNGSIDWEAVKNAGISYVIIRCGYRGYGTGVLVEDSFFVSNIQGALNAGLEVGVYFFSQAVTTTEAVEEASMVLQLVSGYSISLPIYIDVEFSNSAHDGRADSLSVSERTAIVKAFCQTIQNSGYTAGIYANSTWLTSYLDMSQLSSYRVWLAQYAATPTYTGTYHMWQYTSSGSISGVSGNVDLNLWYY